MVTYPQWGRRSVMWGNGKVATQIKENHGDEVEEDIEQRVKNLEGYLNQILETKNKEIQELKNYLEQNNRFLQEIILKLIDKPTPKSATELYLANKTANSSSSVPVKVSPAKLPLPG